MVELSIEGKHGRERRRRGRTARQNRVGSDLVVRCLRKGSSSARPLAAEGSKGGKRGGVSLDRLSETMFDYAVLALGAMVLAIALCLAIRGSGLRWSWALVPLPLAAGLVPLIPRAGLAGLTLFATAGWLGYVRERQDIERGGTEAQIARERSGPLTRLKAYLHARRWRRERVRGGRLALGSGGDGAVVTVPFGATQGTRAFIVGAPGSGKTVSLATHADAYAAQGLPVISVDPKGDRDHKEKLRALAEKMGKRFLDWSPEGPASYNPLGRGAPSEIADKALAGEEWSEPHYLRQAQRYLGLEVQALEATALWPPTLSLLVEYLDPSRLEALADRIDGELRQRLQAYLDSLSQRSRSDLGGVRDRLAILSESSLGRWLEPSEAADEIDLASVMAEGAIVYFQLDSDRFPLASQMLGAAIVVDLVSLSGELQGRPLRGLVMVDEFAAVAAEEISRLLSRSRSAGLSVLVATQAFADLSLARMGDSTESLRRQVLSHVDYLVAHRQSEPEAAELLGQMAGTKAAWAVARREAPGDLVWQSGDQVTRRRTREFVRHPEEFKALGVGEAIVIEPAGKRRASRVRVWPA